MKRCFLFLWALIAVGLSEPVHAQKMQKAEEPQEVGLTSLGDAPFPAPSMGFAYIENFEKRWENSDALKMARFERIESDDAPEGEAYLIRQKGSVPVMELNQPAREATPYLVSAWLRTTAAGTGSASSDTTEILYGKHTPLEIPDTGGKWRRVGFYFRSAVGATAVKVSLRFGADDESLALDDVRFREATEAEFSKAYGGWRSQYPERDLSPRPDDGKHLALFVSKLTRPAHPELPLKVMGIGSSYTNMLGNGERLVQWVREHFPAAPPIHYQKHVGSAVEFDFTRGWMRQHVLGERPDLVILYSGGKPEDLEKLLADFRANSSADVIVASLHLRERDVEITEATINAPEWDQIRDVARKYGCEWVDSRREWGAYLRQHEQPIEWLLKDAVHQNDHGALVINENICRHVAPHPAPAYRPESRERWLDLSPATGAEAEGVIGAESGEIRLRFRGNRIDLIGRKSPDGGALGVGEPLTLDGVPLDELPVFQTTLIMPGVKNARPERGSPADRSPHQVILGDPGKIIPQSWTIRMYGDAGAYELIGSVTGHDGYGHNGDDFTGDSGQITVPSALWRRRLEADGETYSNRDGDTFSWEVTRATRSEIDFRGEAGEVFAVTLADQLAVGWHELVIPTNGNAGEILGFRVCEPALDK